MMNPLMGNGFWIVLAMALLLAVSTTGLAVAAWRSRRGGDAVSDSQPWDTQEARKGPDGTRDALMLYFGLLVFIGIGILLVRLLSGY